MAERFKTMLSTVVTAMKASPLGRTEAIRQLHEDARRAENAWPGTTPKVPPPNGNQNLTLQQLNALAAGPNT